MTLDEFIWSVRADIDNFRDHWRERRKACDRDYPDEMSLEEWQEQMIAFVERGES